MNVILSLMLSIIITYYIRKYLSCKKYLKIIEIILITSLTLFVSLRLYNYWGFTYVWIAYISLYTMLIIATVIDIKRKTVSLNIIIIFGIIGVIMFFVNPNIKKSSAMLSALGIGGLFFIISYITKQAVGYGDAMLISVIGLYLGLKYTVVVLIISTIISGLVGLVLITIKKVNKKSTMPYAPFLLLGMIMAVLFIKGGI